MKRIIYLALATAVFAGLAAPLVQAQSQTQSLGDYARTVRKQKDQNKGKDAQPKQYDNDNLPTTPAVSVVGPPANDAGNNSGPQSADSSASSQSGEASKPQSSPLTGKDRQKMNDDWKVKIDAQKDKLDLAMRELDVLQREYKLRAAAFYADAGNRLRNSGDWDKEDTQYKQQIADKQKAVDDAKKALDDLQEQARKAGASASARE